MKRLKEAVCNLVSIAEEHIYREEFEELDNAGVAIMECLDELKAYRDAEEQCIKENTFGFKVLMDKWKEFIEDIAELLEYRRLKEQGLLLRLPCKVGTKVYYISPHNTISLEKGVIYEGDITRVYAMEKEICVTIKIDTDWGCTELSNITDFGKTVFLTKEEAERALSEMGGE